MQRANAKRPCCHAVFVRGVGMRREKREIVRRFSRDARRTETRRRRRRNPLSRTRHALGPVEKRRQDNDRDTVERSSKKKKRKERREKTNSVYVQVEQLSGRNAELRSQLAQCRQDLTHANQQLERKSVEVNRIFFCFRALTDTFSWRNCDKKLIFFGKQVRCLWFLLRRSLGLCAYRWRCCGA